MSVRQVDAVCLVSVVAICGAGFFVALKALRVQSRSAGQKRDALTQTVANLTAAKEGLAHLSRARAAASGELDRLSRFIARAGKIPAFLEQLDALMRQHGVELVNFQPESQSRKTKYAQTPVNLVLRGPFVSLHALLYDVETTNPAMWMERLRLYPDPEGGWCRAELRVLFFDM